MIGWGVSSVSVSEKVQALAGADDHARVCVLVASSDNTIDVFSKVSRSFSLFWPDCPFPKYVGVNTPAMVEQDSGFEAVCASVAGWRPELAAQVRRLPSSITHILLFLDDFLLLDRVNSGEIGRIVEEAQREGVSYLRLVPISRAFIPNMLHALYRKIVPVRRELIPDRMPYYSSLQVALWRRDHLQDMLALSGNIWDFENQSISGVSHYAVNDVVPVKYVHVVEKGKWKRRTGRLFHAMHLPFSPGNREVLTAFDQFVIDYNKIKFMIIGYLYVNLKRFISQKK